MSTDPRASPPKRRRGEDGSVALSATEELSPPPPLEEATPRPTRSLRLADAAPASLGPSSSSAYTSGTSRSGSPRKQLASLRSLAGGPGGAETCPIDIEDERMPVDLVDLLLALQTRMPLLSLAKRPDIEEHYRGTRAARQWVDAALYGEERDALGPTPAPSFVDDIVQQARECDRYLLDEGAWSNMVHYPLLRCIFGRTRSEEPASPFKDLVVVPCMSASVIPRYRLMPAPFKKVDFTVAYQPRAAAADRLRRVLRGAPAPDASLNHTAYPGLCDRPVVLSVEVKRAGDGGDEAKLQLLAWLGAQWNKMAELAPGSSVSRPTYLLSLLIQGHDWSLVACSRDPDSQQTVLWHRLPLGDTQTALGVYKIIQQVQQLAQTALVPFCEWYQSLG